MVEGPDHGGQGAPRTAGVRGCPLASPPGAGLTLPRSPPQTSLENAHRARPLMMACVGPARDRALSLISGPARMQTHLVLLSRVRHAAKARLMAPRCALVLRADLMAEVPYETKTTFKI